jgi:hypothetical protein
MCAPQTAATAISVIKSFRMPGALSLYDRLRDAIIVSVNPTLAGKIFTEYLGTYHRFMTL